MNKRLFGQGVMILSLLFGMFVVSSPNRSYANSPDVIKTGNLDFDLDYHTARGGDGTTYYSRNSSLTPKSIDFASLGIDTSRLQSATLISTLGTATCSTTACTFADVSGTPNPVHSETKRSIAGYFDWWRNQAGSYHSYWWSFDLDEATHYSIAGGEQGYYDAGRNVPVAERDFPGDSAYPVKNWNVDGSGLTYSNDGSIGNLSSAYVALESAALSLQPGSFVVNYPTTVTADSSGNISFDAEVGPFDGSGPDYTQLGSSPLGYSFPYGFDITFKGQTYTYTGSWTLNVFYSDGGGGDDPTPPPPSGGSGSCTPTIGSPSQGTTMPGSILDPAVSGVIKADNRGSEKFDVLQGIPTSESLYTNALAYNYLYKQNWAQMSGKITYSCSVTVTYTRKWQESQPDKCYSDGEGGKVCVSQPPKNRQDSQSKSYQFTIERSYSYWQINNLEVYKINRATMSNYALPGGNVTMNPTGYIAPTLQSRHDANVNNHVYPASSPTITYNPPIVQGGLDSPPSLPDDRGTLKGMAEKTPDPQVKNDLVKFNGSNTMSDALTTRDGPTPGNIPSPTTIGENVLYKSGNVISNSLVNQANTPSTGTIYYDVLPGNVGGGANLSFPIPNINTVTVHTPVVNYASVSDDQAHHQKTNPTVSRSAFILDRPFSVTIPTSGQHLNIPGYGNRDYGKYTKDKQVWFPFDVYNADKSKFIPKETWISIPVSQETTTFFLPVWVDEGNYEVLFRTFAENSPSSGFTTQMNANSDLTNHVTTQVVPVEVIGRFYDFRITDIADYNWETVFRTQKGSATPTGNAYWVGTNGIDGTPRGNQPPFVLPIRQGSNPLPGMMNIAVKTGYHFKFEVKTKGNMFGSKDGIRITPTFTFVDKTGNNRQPVDLYYHTNDKKFVRIGSSDDTEKRYVTLDTRLRNVPQQELTNTAASLWSLSGNTGITQESYIDKYLTNAQKPTYVGGYDVLILSPQLRTFLGSMSVPSGVDAARANASIQLWRGEYSLPAAPYVVPKGTDLAEYGKSHRLDDSAPIFLKDGYIVVHFSIETIRNQDLDHPHLQYIHAPLSNQWQTEGFQRSFTDPYGATFQLEDGDVVFYNADQSSYDDFGTGGTH